jgi:hypothetical protein
MTAAPGMIDADLGLWLMLRWGKSLKRLVLLRPVAVG